MDPRGLKKEDWEWAELNAYHSAEAAKQILVDMDHAIADANALRAKERGESDNKFKKYWENIWPEKN